MGAGYEVSTGMVLVIELAQPLVRVRLSMRLSGAVSGLYMNSESVPTKELLANHCRDCSVSPKGIRVVSVNWASVSRQSGKWWKPGVKPCFITKVAVVSAKQPITEPTVSLRL